MEHRSIRSLEEIAPLLYRLDRGEALTPEEQAELALMDALDGMGWTGELPASIAALSGLKKLKLNYAKVSNIAPLTNLNSLIELSLKCTQVVDLTPLKGMNKLKILDLQGTKVSDLSPLAGMNALRFLNLRGTAVCDLTPLKDLKMLEWLNLRFTQVSDLTPLKGLNRLVDLGLTYTKVSDLNPLRELLRLQRLRLGNTPISDLTPLLGVTDLRNLALYGTQINDMAPLIQLENLYHIDLQFCNIRSIPREIYNKCPSFVFNGWRRGNVICLQGTTLSTQPISIFRESPEVIEAYYDAPKVPVRESKVIFLGDGGAGKSWTIQRILRGGDDTGIETDPTLGIAIEPHKVRGASGDFSINFWDFGGQENMHAMHRCFLTERTLYVVVISNRWNLDQQARYWLDNIKSFAPKAPVILALNQWEGIREFGLDTNRLQRDYPNLVTVVPYCAKEKRPEDFAALTSRIVTEAEKLDSCAMELPVDWAAILGELRELAAKEVGDDFKGHIDKQDYLTICEKHNLGGEKNEAVRTWLLEWFNDLGVCFSYHRDKQTKAELDEYKVLNPRWLTSAIYILLNHADLTVENGCVTHSEIRKTLKCPCAEEELERKDKCKYILPGVKYEPVECSYILQVMRKFGLSYLAKEGQEFIPALCDGKTPDDLHPTSYSRRIAYEFRYSFLPDSVVQRLMVRLCGKKPFTKLWNRGFRSDEDDHGLITVVDGGGAGDKLRIDIYSTKHNSGQDVMMGLISKITEINEELNLRPEEFVIVRGNRGEFVAPADMILKAKEQGLRSIHLYSRENGLVEQDVNKILGETYGEEIVKAAETVGKIRETGISESIKIIISQHNHYGNIYHNNTPDELVGLLRDVTVKNIEFSENIMAQLLKKLESSGEVGKKIAEDAEKAGKGGFLKSLLGGVKNCADLISGTKTIVEGGTAAVKAAKSAVDAIWPVILPYLVEQAPEVIENLANMMR